MLLNLWYHDHRGISIVLIVKQGKLRSQLGLPNCFKLGCCYINGRSVGIPVFIGTMKSSLAFSPLFTHNTGAKIQVFHYLEVR